MFRNRYKHSIWLQHFRTPSGWTCLFLTSAVNVWWELNITWVNLNMKINIELQTLKKKTLKKCIFINLSFAICLLFNEHMIYLTWVVIQYKQLWNENRRCYKESHLKYFQSFQNGFHKTGITIFSTVFKQSNIKRFPNLKPLSVLTLDKFHHHAAEQR